MLDANNSTAMSAAVGGRVFVDEWPRSTYAPPFWYTVAERLVCGTALLLFLPLILILMVIIRLDSPGSPLFIQQRISKGAKRPFSFMKLRSMHIESAIRHPELCAYDFSQDEVAEVKLSVKNDPRVTRVGKFLRESSLDELPNLWNVVTGEMTLVGPRPEMWVMLPYYNKKTLRKFSVKPGITGYAQVCGRGDLTFEETVELDLQYIKEVSLKTDLACLRETFFAVVLRRGAH